METLEALTLSNQTLVQITVRDRKLDIYPRRSQDAVVYHVDPDKASLASPAKPHQVRWVVSGLGEGMRVVIQSKDGQTPHLEATGTPLEFTGPGEVSMVSGPPVRGPAPGRDLRWAYDVMLYEKEVLLHSIDPTVVIIEDP